MSLEHVKAAQFVTEVAFDFCANRMLHCRVTCLLLAGGYNGTKIQW